MMELCNLRQEPNESIRDYLLRFDKSSIVLEAFKNDLRAGPLNSKLTRKMPRNMQELSAQTEKFVKEEEYNVAKMMGDKWGSGLASALSVEMHNTHKVWQQGASQHVMTKGEVARKNKLGPYQQKTDDDLGRVNNRRCQLWVYEASGYRNQRQTLSVP